MVQGILNVLKSANQTCWSGSNEIGNGCCTWQHTQASQDCEDGHNTNNQVSRMPTLS